MHAKYQKPHLLIDTNSNSHNLLKVSIFRTEKAAHIINSSNPPLLQSSREVDESVVISETSDDPQLRSKWSLKKSFLNKNAQSYALPNVEGFRLTD
jgi:hypothetical protein